MGDMTTKSTTLRTRPFQPFFLAANDLLNLALPYYQQIEQDRQRFKETGIVKPLPKGVWQLDKSLSIGSFVIKYMGLEAFVNCVHRDFRVRSADDLPVDYFIGPLQTQRKQILTKEYGKLYLPTRVFLVIPLCSEPIVDPRIVFDVTGSEWAKFIETVKIRHSFNHAEETEVHYKVTRAGPKLWLANDENPENFWTLTGTHRDHRILNFQSASQLNSIIDWVVSKIRAALPEQLNDTYMSQENMQISE